MRHDEGVWVSSWLGTVGIWGVTVGGVSFCDHPPGSEAPMTDESTQRVVLVAGRPRWMKATGARLSQDGGGAIDGP
jgi:hypothetical protein